MKSFALCKPGNVWLNHASQEKSFFTLRTCRRLYVCVCVLRILKKDKNIYVNNSRVLSAKFFRKLFLMMFLLSIFIPAVTQVINHGRFFSYANIHGNGRGRRKKNKNEIRHLIFISNCQMRKMTNDWIRPRRERGKRADRLWYKTDDDVQWKNADNHMPCEISHTWSAHSFLEYQKVFQFDQHWIQAVLFGEKGAVFSS